MAGGWWSRGAPPRPPARARPQIGRWAVAVVAALTPYEAFAQEGGAAASTTAAASTAAASTAAASTTSAEPTTTAVNTTSSAGPPSYWTPGTVLPDRYACKTMSCAKYDEWEVYPVNFTNSSLQCREAQSEFTKRGGFIQNGPGLCREFKASGMDWEDCRTEYCATYDRAVQKLWHLGGPGYYGFDECRALLDFNRTLCETEYRDAEAFCECYCPTLELLQPIPGCEEEIFAFLLLGKRSPELALKFPMTAECSMDLCRYYEQIGNPTPANPVELAFGVPEQCHALGLPFRPKQCERMMTTTALGQPVIPYEPCPWRTPGEKEDVLICSDGTTHDLNPQEADSWSVCVDHSFRWTCPANYPVMCEDRNCDGSEDHCCQTEVWRCRAREERQCSVALIEDLPEWHGFLTPEAVIRRGTTTTYDPLQAYLGLTSTTTIAGGGIAGQVGGILPIAIGIAVAFGSLLSLSLCLYLGWEHVRSVAKTLVGAPRIMQAYRTDPVSVFGPSRDVKDSDRDPLPPFRTREEAEKDRQDRLANRALQAAVDAAFLRGFRGLCAFDGAPPPAEEEPLINAMMVVRARGLEETGKNAELLERAEQWLRTLRAERNLMRVAAEARPAIDVLTQKGSHLNAGDHFPSTFAGQLAEANIRDGVWSKVENLTVALKQARLAGAQEALVRKEANLLAEVVARVPELPADRCVLDPDGEGLKLLPRGQQRALQTTFGGVYYYDSETRIATDVGEEPPPKSELGAVGTEGSRPCCAEWVRSRKCKGGRRCPWRHEMPRAGDAVRECILRREDDR